MELIIKSPKHGDYTFYFDSEFETEIKMYRWKIKKNKEGLRPYGVLKGSKGLVVASMHLLICKVKEGDRVIHIDGNKFNNSKCNLRILLANEYVKYEQYYEIIIESFKWGKKVAFIDISDYDKVNKYSWHLKHQKGRFYVNANDYSSGSHKMITLHRLVMDYPENLEVDHIDNDGLNNRKWNLRIGTHAQNNMNKGLQTSNRTGFKGVHYFKRDGNYQSYINVNKKRIHGGYFDNPIEAAKRYNELAIKYHGQFAKLNIIPDE